MSLKDIKGQSQVVALLEKAIEKNRLPHALLFAGPPGAGQKQMAVEVAKILFCEKKKGLEVCGICANCHQLSGGAHPDLYILEPEKDYEDKGVRPGTVFSCGGAVMNGRLYIYYGGADQFLGAASIDLNQLLKELT